MEYKDKLKDSISRSIKIMNSYDGKYKTTLLINTAYIVIGQLVEYYGKKEIKKDKFNQIYKLLDNFSESVMVEEENLNTDYTREDEIVTSLRNAIAHYDVEFKKKGNYNEIRFIGKNSAGDKVKVKTTISENNLKLFVCELPKIID